MPRPILLTLKSFSCKTIKKQLKILHYLVEAFLLLLLLFYITLQSAWVQTYISQELASSISKKLETKVSVEGVDIEFFKTVVVEGLYVEDHRRDTLLYVKELKVEMEDYYLSEQNYLLNSLVLCQAKFYLKKYLGEEELNLNVILSGLEKKDSTRSNQSSIFLKKLGLIDVSFTYHDQNMPTGQYGINYWDIDVSQLNTLISNIHMNADTITGELKRLSLSEKSGFEIREFLGNIEINPQKLNVAGLHLLTDKTDLNGDLRLDYNQYSDFKDFINKVKMDAGFDSSYLDLHDIAYFTPLLEGIAKRIEFDGVVRGTVSNLKSRGMHLGFGSGTYFQGDIDMQGLPNINETFILIEADKILTHKADIDLLPLPPFTSGKTVNTPTNVGRLGEIEFTGNFTGFVNDFVAYGRFNTALGTITTDLGVYEQDSTLHYRGEFVASDFNLGGYIDNEKLLGKISVDASVEGAGTNKNNAQVKLDGMVQRIQFNGYNYDSLGVSGDLENGKFTGLLSLEDENVKLDFDGSIDNSESLPKLYFESTISHANLNALNLLKRDSLESLSTKVISSLTGNKPENLEGEVWLINTNYSEGGKQIHIDTIALIAQRVEGKSNLKLQSDVVQADLTGKFNTADLPRAITNLVYGIIPSLFSKPPKVATTDHDFEYTMVMQNTNSITDIFYPAVTLFGRCEVNGNYSSVDNRLMLNVDAPELKFKNQRFKGIRLKTGINDDIAQVDIDMDKIWLTDSATIENVNVHTKTISDITEIALSWHNNDTIRYEANLAGLAQISGPNAGEISFLPSEIIVADSIWKVQEGGELIYDSEAIRVRDFAFSSGKQSFKANGKLSKSKYDQLQVAFENLQLANLNLFTAPIGLVFEGEINGKARFSMPKSGLLFTSDLRFDSVYINQQQIGWGTAYAGWNRDSKSIEIFSDFHNDLAKIFEAKGHYYPMRKEENLDVDVAFKHLELVTFKPFVDKFLSEVRGEAFGDVHLGGMVNQPRLEGELELKTAFLKVIYLNTGFSIDEQKFVIQPDWMGFNHINIQDEQGHDGYATGTITHDNFRNFHLDVGVQADHRFQCLNTTASENQVYYGKAFIDSALINVEGYTDNLLIDVHARTGKGTQFFIPLSGSKEVSESSFIRFVSHDSTQTKTNKNFQVDLNGVKMNFAFDITPDAKIQLIFDEKAGDVVRAQGNGNLRLEINTLGKFNIYGDYIIKEGDYLFTLQNILNKKFVIDPGSSIIWDGNAYDANLNINAIYKVRAPLSGLGIAQMDSTSSFSKRVPINCVLKMRNLLSSPLIEPDIQLPSAGPGVRDNVAALLSNAESKNRQFFSLLLINRFLPQDPSQYAAGGSGIGVSSTTEMLSSQLSGWLSQISNDFDIGLNYRPGDDVTNDEIEVALSTQLFDDRLSIDGNFGYSGNNTSSSGQTTSGIVGDVKLEYKISKDGRFRAKVYNQSNNYDLADANNAPYTQGVGLSYRQEFNSFRELFRNLFTGKKKKKVIKQ